MDILKKYFPNGLLIGERREKITSLIDDDWGESMDMFDMISEYQKLESKYLFVCFVCGALSALLIAVFIFR